MRVLFGGELELGQLVLKLGKPNDCGLSLLLVDVEGLCEKGQQLGLVSREGRAQRIV